ncbi:MAG TPA: iron export ABC transporter permease subunit FetB [Polyangiaceae bacterium]|nr:iron export ABC transporter permease subunit FetB [Polyangiaceae bacterium]
MLHGVLPIPPERLALASLSVALLFVIAWKLRLGIGKAAVTSALRGTAQLVAVGYVLGAIFAVPRFDLVLATFLVMLGVAARTGMGRVRKPIPGLSWLAFAAILSGTSLGVVVMTVIAVRPEPWWDPQYVIPFGGMLLGNGMNGSSLAGERFLEDLRIRRPEVEARLCLGFTGPDAVHPMLARALRASLIPTFNSFAVAGVVQLPGMMTGQLLSGVAPLVAVEYQILIFFMLMTSTAVSTLVFLLLLRGRCLTAAHQLRVHVLR